MELEMSCALSLLNKQVRVQLMREGALLRSIIMEGHFLPGIWVELSLITTAVSLAA